MALELDSISFAVNTEALEKAVAKVNELKSALQQVNTSMKNVGSSAVNKQNKANKEQSKSVEDTAKASENLVQVTKEVDAVTKNAAASSANFSANTNKVTYAIEKQEVALDVLRGTTLKLKDGELELQRVYTNGQANRIAALKLQGATVEQMQKYTSSVSNQNSILGVNPFDQSASGIEKLKKSITELNSVNQLMNEGLGLTKQQVISLARDIEAERQNFAKLGMDSNSTEFKARIDQLKTETALKAKEFNALSASAVEADRAAKEMADRQRKQQEENYKLASDIGRQKHIDLRNSIDAEIAAVESNRKVWRDYYKEQESAIKSLDKQRSQAVFAEYKKQQNPSEQMNDPAVAAFYKNKEEQANRVAKAEAFLERETQRANNALAGLKGELEGVNGTIGVSTANRLNKYSEELKQAGVAADIAKQKLAGYANTLAESDKLRAEQHRKEKMNQVEYAARATSVQLGDIGISLAGGQNPLTVFLQQGDQLRAVLSQTKLSAEELNKVMSSAFGQIVRGFVDVSKALGTFVISSFKTTGESAVNLVYSLVGLDTYMATIRSGAIATATGMAFLDKVMRVVAVSSLMLFITSAVAAVVALKSIITQENELTKAMAMTSGQFGVSRTQVDNYIVSIGALTNRSSLVNEAFVAMAKEGGIASDKVMDVAIAAINMNKAMGVPIEDTVKKFSELGKKPSETIVEIAKATGMIDTETLKLVHDYEEVGRKSEAASIATDAYAAATKQAADTVQQNYGVLTTFAMSVGNVFKLMWDNILGVDRKMTTQEKIKDIATQISELRDGKGIFGSGINGIGGREDRINVLNRQMEALYKEAAAQASSADSKAETAKIADKLDSFWKERDKFASKREKRLKEEELYVNSYKELLTKGKITQEDYNTGLADIAKKYKDEKTPKSSTEKFADSSLKLFIRDAAEAEGVVENLTKAQVNLLKIIQDPEWTKINKTERDRIVTAFQNAQVLDLQAKATKELKKEEEARLATMNEMQTEVAKLDEAQKRNSDFQVKALMNLVEGKITQEDYNRVMQDYNTAIININNSKLEYDANKFNNDSKLENDLLDYKMSITSQYGVEYDRLLKYKEIDIQLSKELYDIENDSTNNKDARKLEAIRQANLKKQFASRELDFVESQRLTQSIADALVTGLTEGGKSGAAKLRSILQAELMKPITVFIQAQVSGLVGGLSSGVTSLAGNQLSGILPTGFSIGNAANVLGAAYLATGLGKALSGGYQVGNAATTNGMSLFGGGATAGLVNRLFGRKLTDSGVQGQYSGNSFTGSNYTFSKGGWFRSDKTTTSSIDPAMQQMLNRTYSGIDKTFTYFADKFDTTVSSSFDSIKVNLKGLSESEAQAKLSEAIATSTKKTLNAINLPKWAEDVLAELGNTFSIDSMNTALSGITAMKDALDNLGAASTAFAGITSDATSELIAEFGGIQTATQNLASYYQNFYPEEQRIEIATTALNKQLAKLGVTIPSSTAAYKKLVDDALIAGNEELAANLISMSGAFYEVKNAIESMTQSVIDEANRLRGEIVGSNASTTLGKNALLAEFGMLTSLARGGDKDAMTRLSEVSKQIEDLTKQQAVSQSEVTKMQSYLSQSLYATAQSLGSALPSYVSANTTTASTSDLSPLTATVQPAGNTASSTAASSQATNAARVEMLLTSLVDNISGLRDEIRADVSHNAKTAKILDRAMQDGQSLAVKVLA